MIKVSRHLCGAFIMTPFLLDSIFLDLNSQEIFISASPTMLGLIFYSSAFFAGAISA